MKQILYRYCGLFVFLFQFGCGHFDRYGYKDVPLGKDISVVVQILHKNYLDPRKINPQAMMVQALSNLENQIPEMRIHPDAVSSQIRVDVGTASQNFMLPKAESLPIEKTRRLPLGLTVLKENLVKALQFILGQVSKDERQNWPRFLEHEALKGMLATLDFHTQLKSKNKEAVLFQAKFSHENQFAYFWRRNFQISGNFFGLLLIRTKMGFEIGLLRTYSPAYKAGLRAGDKVQRVGGYTVSGMNESEMWFLLHFWKDRQLPVCVLEKELLTERCFQLQADSFRYDEVDVYSRMLSYASKMLSHASKIGYIQIPEFAYGTSRDFDDALDSLVKQGMKSLILDLRDNLGGQANEVGKISEKLMGNYWTQNVWFTLPSDIAPIPSFFPIVVLINGRSASGAELLAGTLKKTGRAIVMGTSSVGKAVGQKDFELPDRSTVDVTGLEYLLPQIESIQRVGLVPDIAVKPLYVSNPNQLSLEPNMIWQKESDWPNAIVSHYQRFEQQPLYTVHYFGNDRYFVDGPLQSQHDPKRKLLELLIPKTAIPAQSPVEFLTDCSSEPEDCSKDEVTQIARKILENTSAFRREDMEQQAIAVLKQHEENVQKKLAQTLQKYDVDWTRVPLQNQQPKLQIRTWVENNAMVEGTADWVVEVTNQGPGTAGQVHAQLLSEEPWLNGKEWVLGKILPGQTKAVHRQIPIPGYLPDIAQVGTLQVFEQHHAEPMKQDVHFITKVPPKPRLAYHYELIDAQHYLDRKIQAGETVKLRVTVKNLGEGDAPNPLILLENLNPKGVLVTVGRHPLARLLPEQEVTRDFEIVVDKRYSAPKAWFRLYIGDAEVLQDPVVAEIQFPVGQHIHKEKIELLNSASFGDNLEGESVHLYFNHDPIFTRKQKFTIDAIAKHSYSVKDAYVLLDSLKRQTQKILYQRNETESKQMKIHTEILLQPGINQITIAARHSSYAMTARTLWVFYQPE